MYILYYKLNNICRSKSQVVDHKSKNKENTNTMKGYINIFVKFVFLMCQTKTYKNMCSKQSVHEDGYKVSVFLSDY